ncbi:hypothetical protein LJR168_003779 [Pseudoxanthomonas sp. LjRoot168]|uniref:hypothetical protein n=1 Tax=unclassified Pseudoxanthomonas TaxID=2645906 RepID=UPI003ECFACDB
MALFGYYIDRQERGGFTADVRNEAGATVYEVRAGNELGPDETSIIDDGFMKHATDMDGLQEYLIQLNIMQPGDELMMYPGFEAALEEREAEEARQAARP